MGYRSDVGIEFYAVDAHKEAVVKMWLREHLPLDHPDFKLLGAFEEIEDGYRFFAADVKWYDTYPAVMRMHEVMEKFVDLFCQDDIGSDAAVEFVRIGEETEDIEIERHGDVDYRVNVRKQICFD